MAKKTKADLETEVRQLKEKAKFWENIAAGHQEEIKEMKADWDYERGELKTIADHWKKSAEEEGKTVKDLRIENKELVYLVGELKEEIEELKESEDEKRQVIKELTDIANGETRIKIEALDKLESMENKWNEHLEVTEGRVASLTKDLGEYMEKLKTTQNELQIKETSLQYIENGLRSAEQEVLTLRQTNRNLLNYLNIIASQDNPNIPKDFNF